jgi:hypothetical protein
MVAERVVDVLEVIEIDVEHRRRRTAVAHLGDHGLEPFAEIDAVGQSADRIVQGEMAQLRLARGDRLGGPAGMAYHQAGEHRETGNRNGDERQHAARDLAAGFGRFPCQAGNGVALRVGDDGHVLVAGFVGAGNDMQAGQLQPIADLAQQIRVDIFDRNGDRRAGIAGSEIAVGADGDCGNDCRFVQHLLDPASRAAGLARIVRAHHRHCGRRHGVEPAAHETDNGRQRRRQLDRSEIAGGARARELDPVGTVDHQDQIMIEERFEPVAEAPLDPWRIVAVADRLCGAGGRGDALELSQHAGATALERVLDQLLVTLERCLVGAPRRNEDNDDQADNGDADDRANGHDQPQPRLIPARPVASPGDVRLRRKVHMPTLWRCFSPSTIPAKRLRFACALC